jgi:uncharacterized protein
MKKNITRISAALFITCSSVGFYYHHKQDEMIFKSKALERDYTYTWNAPFKEVFIPVGQKDEINALHFHVENPKGAILFLHGRGKNLSHWGKRAEVFIKQGYDVLIFDYRGFGKSSSTQGGFKEKYLLEDSECAYQYLKKFYSEENIVVYGQSLGTSFAAWVASKHSPRMLILEAPYYNMHEAALYTKPYLPRWAVGMILKFSFKTNEWIQGVSSPIFIFHGTDDDIVPYAHSKRLYEELKTSKAIEFITLDAWGHSEFYRNDLYLTKLTEILN